MLVLRRKAGQAILIDGTTEVIILAIEGERIKVGVRAPASVAIVRTELLPPHEPAAAPDRPVPAATSLPLLGSCAQSPTHAELEDSHDL